MSGAEHTAASCVSAIVEHVFEQYPNTARLAGRHDQDGRLPQSCARSAADLGLLAATAARHLGALPDDADPELRADLDAAVRMAEGERFRATELGQPHLTPLEALAEVDLSPYLRPYAPLAERQDALDAHLSRLPSFLADAAGSLPDRLPAGERLLGAEQAQAQAINIGSVVRQLAQAEGPDGQAPDGQARSAVAAERRAAAAEAASVACADFARAVAATRPSPGLLGPDRLAEFLQITEGIDHHPGDLLEEASAEVASLLSALDSAARNMGAAGRRGACELMADQVSDASATEHLISVIERLRDFWERQDIVSMYTVLPLEVRPAVGLGTATTVDFSLSPPLEPVRQPHILYLPEPPAANGDARSQVRRRYLNDPMIEVIAVHEVYAGHYLHAEATACRSSVVRACFPCISGYTEGWAHYAEELAVEHGLADGRPLVRLAQLKSALESAVRLVSYLSMHLMRSPFAEAAALAARTCDWSAERAAREVLVVAADPRPAMYALAKLRIREWRAAAGAASRPSLKAFHDRLMQCGNAPLATVWRYYLDGEHAGPVAGTGGATTNTEVP
jgi:uncharacterized protein (DUF885 family)